MGMYINENSKGIRLSHFDKAHELVADGATILKDPPTRVTLEDGSRPFVCIVHNPSFDAAAWCYDEHELREFARETDFRPKTWLQYPHAEAIAR